MSYIENNLLPDERIAFQTNKSLVIFAFPLNFFIVGLIFYFLISFAVNKIDALSHLAQQTHALNILLIVILAICAFSALKVWLEYITASFVVTNRRLIMKEGFFVRRMSETRLSAISHVSIQQHLLGQLLNYGTVFINSFGGNSDHFSQISSPTEFQKQVHGQLDKIPR